jgi:hypothetical protein
MWSRNLYPAIEPSMVRCALASLRFWSKQETSQPLENLLMVDLLLLDLDAPLSAHQRGFALKEILVCVIMESLAAHRRKFALLGPHEDEDFQAAQCAVALDGRNGNVELLGWSLLYYFFVRTDLNFSHELFADLIGVETRSVRRYQQHAIRRLTDRLIQREWQARKTHRRRYAYTRLPIAKPLRLVGRETEFAQARYMVNELGLNHIQVTGTHGVGKTAFVQEFIRVQIEAETVDALIWMDQPRSVAAIQKRLSEELLLYERRSTLREFLALHRVVVVIDDVDDLRAEPGELKALLEELSEAKIILVNRLFLTLIGVPAYIHLSDLAQEDAVSLIRMLGNVHFRGREEKLGEDEVWHVWSTAGGNPEAIMQTMYALTSEVA